MVFIDLKQDGSVSGDAYSNISGFDLNISGEKISFNSTGMTVHEDSGYNSLSRDIYTTSENTVIVPWEIFEAMMTVEDVRIRVYSDSKYQDSLFSQDRAASGQRTARLAIVPLYEKVKQIR